MTIREAVALVANDYRKTMEDEGFDTFKEMAQCYWWTSEDIKEETQDILKEVTGGRVYIDEDDGTLVFNEAEDKMPYKAFISLVRKEIVKRSKAA